jgi:hypothetical protein
MCRCNSLLSEGRLLCPGGGQCRFQKKCKYPPRLSSLLCSCSFRRTLAFVFKVAPTRNPLAQAKPWARVRRTRIPPTDGTQPNPPKTKVAPFLGPQCKEVSWVGDVRMGDARCHSASRNSSSGNVEDNRREWSCFEFAASLLPDTEALAEPKSPIPAVAANQALKYLKQQALSPNSRGSALPSSTESPTPKVQRPAHTVHATAESQS